MTCAVSLARRPNQTQGHRACTGLNAPPRARPPSKPGCGRSLRRSLAQVQPALKSIHKSSTFLLSGLKSEAALRKERLAEYRRELVNSMAEASRRRRGTETSVSLMSQGAAPHAPPAAPPDAAALASNYKASHTTLASSSTARLRASSRVRGGRDCGGRTSTSSPRSASRLRLRCATRCCTLRARVCT